MLSIRITCKSGGNAPTGRRIARWLIKWSPMLLWLGADAVWEAHTDLLQYSEALFSLREWLIFVGKLLSLTWIGYLGIVVGWRPLHDYAAGTDLAYFDDAKRMGT